MNRYVRFVSLAAIIAFVILVAPAVRDASADQMGRWKIDGNGGCYWDENDEGPDQCDPNNPDGRHKLDGNGTCYWEPNDHGPDQCTPGNPPPPPPPPPPNKFVILVNGSLTNPSTSWTAPGSAMYDAVRQTYGVEPTQFPWTSNSAYLVSFVSGYAGQNQGAFELANLLNALPAGEVNLISHSHGGNVVLWSQAYAVPRPIRRYLQLGTPVNDDWGGWRLALDYGVAGRCQISSWNDWVQFAGASFDQIWNWAVSMALAYAAGQQAYDAIAQGDWEAAAAWFAAATFAGFAADYWWWSTKAEYEGPTWWFQSVGHSALHEPHIWNLLPSSCK